MLLVGKAAVSAYLGRVVAAREGQQRADTGGQAAQRGPLGSGTPSCRQMPRPVGVLISRWRGTVACCPASDKAETAMFGERRGDELPEQVAVDAEGRQKWLRVARRETHRGEKRSISARS